MKGMKLIVACALAGAAGYWHVAPVGAIPVCGVRVLGACPGCEPNVPQDSTCGCFAVGLICNCQAAPNTPQNGVIVDCGDVNYYYFQILESGWVPGGYWEVCKEIKHCNYLGPWPSCGVRQGNVCVPLGTTICNWHADPPTEWVWHYTHGDACP
jgi:hypothetical protein